MQMNFMRQPAARKLPRFEGRSGEDFETCEGKIKQYLDHYKIMGNIPQVGVLKDALRGEALIYFKSLEQAGIVGSLEKAMEKLRSIYNPKKNIDKIRQKLHGTT